MDVLLKFTVSCTADFKNVNRLRVNQKVQQDYFIRKCHPGDKTTYVGTYKNCENSTAL